MANVLAFGDVAFGTSDACMVQLKRARRWRWSKQEVVDVAPRLSFTGPGETTLSLDGVVYPGQLGELDAVARLEALADAAEPRALVDAEGRSYGRFVIEAIDQDQGAFLGGGTPRRIAWTMTLSLYPEDQA